MNNEDSIVKDRIKRVIEILQDIEKNEGHIRCTLNGYKYF
jgi:hypothetical protein